MRRVLFGLVIFLSAFLLFQVQLVVAKHLLPWFGGAPAVWTTCQLFFQVSLVAGYGYAYLLDRLQLHRQRRVHLGFLIAAVTMLVAVSLWSGTPLLAPEAFKPSGAERPAALLLLVLTLTVGLPFFVLSATGPLLQRWHSYSTDSLDRTYRLYALSNAGSLLSLLSYPFGFERMLDLPRQAGSWTILFLIFAVAFTVLAYRVSARPLKVSSVDLPASNLESENRGVSNVADRYRPWLWLLLSFASSAMFLSTTNEFSLEVASAPFLWVLTLAIYLLTFIICFDRPFWYSRRFFTIVAAASSLIVLAMTSLGFLLPIRYSLLVYGLFLAVFCMVCHGELARLRPGSSNITKFYFLIALGGASGGVFVGLAAPRIFTDVLEFHMTLLLGWIVFALVGFVDPESAFHTGDRWQFAFVTAVLSVVGAHFFILWTNLHRTAWIARFDWAAPLALGAGVTLLASIMLWRSQTAANSIWPRLLAILLMLIAGKGVYERMNRLQEGTQFAARDFYGLVRVRVSAPSWDGRGVKAIVDGTTVHGVQLVGPESKVPAAYYSPSSGLAAAVRHLTKRTNLHFGILGMGAGAMAAFARPGDRVRYYELNPTIIELSQGPNPHFTFIRDCAGEVSILAGDGRFLLERELIEKAPQKFDLLAMDAFSSDAVPVHLLTEEAFEIYAGHLRDADSILAVNITNRHLDLEPVVHAAARRLGFHGMRIETKGDPPLPQASSWILLSRNHLVFLDRVFAATTAKPLADREIVFTDRYSNLFSVLK